MLGCPNRGGTSLNPILGFGPKISLPIFRIVGDIPAESRKHFKLF